MDALGWVDWSLLAVLTVSVLVGLWRGFIFEVLSLLGWVAAYFLAQWYAPSVAPRLPVGTPGSALNHAAAFALVFIASVLVWSIGSRLLQMLVKATPLRAIDRLLGAVFGALRGALLLLVVATVVALTPAAAAQDWQASHGARWLAVALEQIRPLLPQQWLRLLPT